MLHESIESAATEVLDQYRIVRTCERISLGNAGGFSGSRLWRINNSVRDYCLRAWPAGSMTADQLTRIHGWMITARDAGMPFVPYVFHANSGLTFVECSGRLWEVTEWLPGQAGFHCSRSRP